MDEVCAKTYFTMVRPINEYAAPVWNPYTQRNIGRIEMVQRRAARFVCGRYHNTSRMLQELKWPSLKRRQEILRLNLFYKMRHNLVIIDTSQHITPTLRTTQNTHQGYQIPTSSAEYQSNSFFLRTVKGWNNLPPDIISAPPQQKHSASA